MRRHTNVDLHGGAASGLALESAFASFCYVALDGKGREIKNSLVLLQEMKHVDMKA